jgi:hypothetical protein
MSVVSELTRKIENWRFAHKDERPTVILLGQNTYARYKKETEGLKKFDDPEYFSVPKFQGVEIVEVCMDEFIKVGDVK